MRIFNIKCNYEKKQMLADAENIVFSWEYEECCDNFVCGRIEIYDLFGNKVWESKEFDVQIFEFRCNEVPIKRATRYIARFFITDTNGRTESAELFFDTAPDFPNDIGAKWIWLDNNYVIPCIVESYYTGYSSPEFYCSFTLKKEPIRAVAYASALGAYEISVNNERIDDSYFNPGWTDYKKRITYQAYDLTNRIHKGENVFKVALADGWYRGFIIFHDCNYGDIPLKFIFGLKVEYSDGTYEYIVSDEKWKAGTGRIRYSDYQMGERYEADIANDDEYYCMDVSSSYDELLNKLLVPQVGPTIKIYDTLNVEVVSWLDEKTVVLNTNQNISGFLKSSFYGLKKDDIITFSYGEMVESDGSVYLSNLRKARQNDYYVAMGIDGEEYTPHFTSHGFQYIQISGLDKEVFENCTFKAIALSAACEPTGSFTCGNDKVNKLYSNLTWGQVDNFSAIPTDCPQRDERLGWTGDAQIFCPTACYNMDCRTYYRKYCIDMLDSQFESGSIGDVVPLLYGLDGIEFFENGNGAWADAIVIIPWNIYLYYNDISILENCYSGMKRYAEFLLKNSNEGIYQRADYGDWLSVNDDTPRIIVAATYAAYDLKLMSKIAGVLGKKDDEEFFAEKFEYFKEAFNRTFVDKDRKVYGDTQTNYLLVLKFGLSRSSEDEMLFAKHLVRRIAENNNHLSSGFVGISYLMPILCKYGYSKLAYDLLLNETYPSWLYSVVNGATTIWERWNSYTIEHGFGDVSMNSFNHYSLGSVGQWMFDGCGGIQPDEECAGFSKIHIHPYTDERLGFCNVNYHSCKGEIRSSWKYENEKIVYEFEIPTAVEAYIYLSDVETFDNATIVEKREDRTVYRNVGNKVRFIQKR